MLNSTLSGSWSINLAFQQFHMDNAMESCRLLPSQRRDARNLDLTFPIEKVLDISWPRILCVSGWLSSYSLNSSHDALMTCAAVPSKSPAVGPWLMGKACTSTGNTANTGNLDVFSMDIRIFIVHSTMPCFHPARRGRHLSWSQRIRISSKKMMK